MPTVKANGINIHYETQGNGDPLVLIMGITAPGSVWERHADYWSQHYQCIIFDNRGVGHTDKPAGPYSSAMMADDTAGLMEALGIEKAHVAGVSMGSIIAQSLAIRHPEKVKAMVLMCPWARCDRKATAIFQHMMTIKARLRPEEFLHYIQLLIFHKSTWDDDAEYQGFLEGQQGAAIDAYPQPLHGLEGQAHACIDHNVVEQLKSVDIPALV
ncbi:MAG: alpha/beta hydrolase, partial [Bacteroidota bacterium]